MNRNVAIVIAILVVVVIAGYFVWLRSRIQQPALPSIEPVIEASPSPVESAVSSASPAASPREATGPARQRTSTGSSISR